MPRKLLVGLCVLPLVLLGATAHNPGDLGQCSHVIYQTTAPDGFIAAAQTVETGAGATEVLVVTQTEVTEVYDANAEWAYSSATNAASWEYSGLETIDVVMQAQLTYLGYFDQTAIGGLFTGHADDADLAPGDISTTGSGINRPAAATFFMGSASVTDQIDDIDTNDAIGLLLKYLSGLGYVNIQGASLTVEIQQVDPPCRN